MNKRWLRYSPTDAHPYWHVVPENDDHPLPHCTIGTECHCQPEVLTVDEVGRPYPHPIVSHSAFDARELIEQAEALMK